MPRDPSFVFGCKGALVTSKGIVLILLEGDLVTDRQTYLSPEIYLTVPNIRAAHLWHLDKLVQYGTICLDKLYHNVPICLDKLYHIGTLLSRQIVPYWYTFV